MELKQKYIIYKYKARKNINKHIPKMLLIASLFFILAVAIAYPTGMIDKNYMNIDGDLNDWGTKMEIRYNNSYDTFLVSHTVNGTLKAGINGSFNNINVTNNLTIEKNITFAKLVSCDVLATDANGVPFCDTDADSGATGDLSAGDDWNKGNESGYLVEHGYINTSNSTWAGKEANLSLLPYIGLKINYTVMNNSNNSMKSYVDATIIQNCSTAYSCSDIVYSGNATLTYDTEWDTQGEVETIWGVTLATDTELSVKINYTVMNNSNNSMLPHIALSIYNSNQTVKDWFRTQLWNGSAVINNTGYVLVSNSTHSGTCSAFLANPTNCGAGEYPLGIDNAGNVESCTDATTEINTEIGNVLDGTDAFTDFNGNDIIDSDNYNADSIDDEHINWGTGANQISQVDIPNDVGYLTNKTDANFTKVNIADSDGEFEIYVDSTGALIIG